MLAEGGKYASIVKVRYRDVCGVRYTIAAHRHWFINIVDVERLHNRTRIFLAKLWEPRHHDNDIIGSLHRESPLEFLDHFEVILDVPVPSINSTVAARLQQLLDIAHVFSS